MHPFYFGSSAKPLFGLYHPPHRETDRHAGVVICYPFGQEYMRGHRAFRQLSLLLSRTGLHVLRFDYYGTGDSGGQSSEVSIPQCIEDIQAAAEELREMADLSSVSLVGTRLGAALGVEAAAACPEIESLVLWDPVVSGPDYLKEIVGAEPMPSPNNGNATAVLGSVFGFPITRQLWDGLQRIDIAKRPPPPRTRIVVSSEEAAYSRLHQAWPDVEYVHVPSKGNWNEVDNFGSALVPQEIIRDIVQWFEEQAVR